LIIIAFSAVNIFNDGYLTKLFSASSANSISTIIFWVLSFGIAILSYLKKYSLIPLLGLTTCMYLLTGMTALNWAWFGGWLALGLVIYFGYGKKHSKLAIQ
ncbi:MAG: amino acid permease C-terminal domain-containing protein, partial [Sediminibacterium sp.]